MVPRAGSIPYRGELMGCEIRNLGTIGQNAEMAAQPPLRHVFGSVRADARGRLDAALGRRASTSLRSRRRDVRQTPVPRTHWRRHLGPHEIGAIVGKTAGGTHVRR